MTAEIDRHVGLIANLLFEATPSASLKLREPERMLRETCGGKYRGSRTQLKKRFFGWCIEERMSVAIAGCELHAAEWLLEIEGRGDAFLVSSSASLTQGGIHIRLGERPARSHDELRNALHAAVAALAATIRPESPLRSAIERARRGALEQQLPGTPKTSSTPLGCDNRWLMPPQREAAGPFAAPGQAEPNIDRLAIAEVVSAIGSFASACERLDDFTRGLGAPQDVHTRWMVPCFDRSFDEKPDERHLEKQIELNIHAGDIQFAEWGLSLGWSEGRWVVGSWRDISHSDFYEDSDNRRASSAAELEHVLAEAVDELIATARPDSALSTAIEGLRAEARQAAPAR